MAVTEAVQQLLKSFNALTDVEKQSAVAEILRRSIEPAPAALSDEQLVAVAEDLFRRYDVAEGRATEGGAGNLADRPEFTESQLREALRRMGRDACQATFAAGRSVIVIKGASLVALHADGREELVEPLDPGTNPAGEQA